MRKLVLLFGSVCTIVIIGLVARHGYKSADNRVDGYISAFMLGTIAIGGLGFHAVAARVWHKSRTWSLIIGFVAAAAMVVNLSNSLGAIAGRSDKEQAALTKIAKGVADDRADLARLTAERATLPAFTATDDASVSAAQRAANLAASVKQLECNKRGVECRKRESEEAEALSTVAKLTLSKAMTDRAANLDGEISHLRAKLSLAGPVQSVNPQGEAIARLFRLPDGAALEAATWQQFAMAAIIELLILLSFVAYEILDDKRAVAAALTSTAPTVEISQLPAAIPPPPPVSTTQVGSRPVSERPLQAPLKLVKPKAPGEIHDEIDATPVIKFIRERMPKTPGGEVDWAEIFMALPEWWRANKIDGTPPNARQLGSILRWITDETGMPTRTRDGRVYFIGRKLGTQ